MRHLPQVVADPPCSPCVHPWCTPVNEWALTTVACAPVQGHGRSITYTATLVAAMKLKLLSSLLILFSVCEVQTVYCIPPIYGACLERKYEVGNYVYEVDIDCCAGCGAGSCAPGYTLSTQTAIAEGGSWNRPADQGFNPQCENLSACNTCCTPIGSVNTGISNTCEVGEPITTDYECRAATQALSMTSQFSGFSYYEEAVSLSYVPNGCFVYDGDSPEHHVFYLNTHAGSATGTPDHHKVRCPRAPCDPAHAQPPESLCGAPLALHTPAPGVQAGGRVDSCLLHHCLLHHNGLHQSPGHGRAGRSNHLPGTDVPRRPSHRHLGSPCGAAGLCARQLHSAHE